MSRSVLEVSILGARRTKSPASKRNRPLSPGSTPRSAKRQSSKEMAGSSLAGKPSVRARRTDSWDTGTPIAGCPENAAQRSENSLDHPAHGGRAALANPVAVVQRFGAGVHAREPGTRCRIRHEIMEAVGTLENGLRLRRDLPGDTISRADDGKRRAIGTGPGEALDLLLEGIAGPRCIDRWNVERRTRRNASVTEALERQNLDRRLA